MNKSKDFDFLIVFNCLLVAKIHFYSKKRPKNTKTLDNVFCLQSGLVIKKRDLA